MGRTSGDDSLPRGVRVRLALSVAAVLWERVWRRLWPAASAAGAALALGVSGLLPRLPGWAHLSVVLALGLGLAGLAAMGLAGVRAPTRHEVERRVERRGGLTHRPLSERGDSIALGGADTGAAALWRAHRDRLSASLRGVRAARPSPGVARLDHGALRAVPVLLLAAALIGAGDRAPARLAAALSPNLTAPAEPVTVTAWLEPPGYTGRAPRTLETGTSEPVEVPEGSRIVAEVHGGDGAPELVLGNRRAELTQADATAWQGELEAGTGGERLRLVRAGRELAAWELSVVADAPPDIAFKNPPKPARDGALRVRYTGGDDHGLTGIKLRVTRPEGEREPVTRALPVAQAGDDGTVSGTGYVNLSAHPWAGLPVRVRLVARDAAGQTATSERVRLPLPARAFDHPVAQKLVELRRELTRNPDAREPVVRVLDGLTSRPGTYGNDTVVTLTLSSAARRLMHAPGAQAVREVQEVLWRTALRLDGGGEAVAARELARARQRLQEALGENASDREIARMARELREAMRDYLRARMEAQTERPRGGDVPSERVDAQQLDRMLEQIRKLAEQGRTEEARRRLAELQNLMQRLRQSRSGQQGERAQRAQKALQDLNELARRQQELLDRTQRRAEGGAQGGTDETAAEQGELRENLGETAQRLENLLGQKPEALGQAGQRMDSAAQALRRRAPGRAVREQRGALKKLQEGLQQAGKRARQMMQGGGGRRRADPLGRRPGGQRSEDGPEEIAPGDAERARAIRDTLRERAGDPGLDPLERSYIERLLERF